MAEGTEYLDLDQELLALEIECVCKDEAERMRNEVAAVRDGARLTIEWRNAKVVGSAKELKRILVIT